MPDQSEIYLGLTIEQLRTKAGIASTDMSADADIEMAFGVALDAIEQYLDRRLRLGDYSEVFTHFSGAVASVKAYPLEVVDVLITASAIEPDFHIEKENGLIHLDGHVRAHELMVTYKGGYKKVPPTLQMVLLSVFGVAFDYVVGNASGNSEVSRISVPDVGSISYETPGYRSSDFDDVGLIPATMVAMLQPYRRILA